MTSSAALVNGLSWSLQVLLVVAAGGALPWLLGLRVPAVRHGYWRALLLICLVLPVVQPWQPVAALARRDRTARLAALTDHDQPGCPLMILVAGCAADAAPPTPWACRPFHAGPLAGGAPRESLPAWRLAIRP